MQDLVNWVFALKLEELPEVPWRLNQFSQVTNNGVFLYSLKACIMKGDQTERAKNGDLEKDLREMKQVVDRK